jgi:hypothetical protein
MPPTRKRIGLVVDRTLDTKLDALALVTGKTRSQLFAESLH